MTNQEKIQALLAIDDPLVNNKHIAYSQNFLARPAKVGGFINHYGNVKIGSNYIVGDAWYKNWMLRHGIEHPNHWYDAKPGNTYIYDPKWDNVCSLSWDMLQKALLRA